MAQAETRRHALQIGRISGKVARAQTFTKMGPFGKVLRPSSPSVFFAAAGRQYSSFLLDTNRNGLFLRAKISELAWSPLQNRSKRRHFRPKFRPFGAIFEPVFAAHRRSSRLSPSTPRVHNFPCLSAFFENSSSCASTGNSQMMQTSHAMS